LDIFERFESSSRNWNRAFHSGPLTSLHNKGELGATSTEQKQRRDPVLTSLDFISGFVFIVVVLLLLLEEDEDDEKVKIGDLLTELLLEEELVVLLLLTFVLLLVLLLLLLLEDDEEENGDNSL
jgi:hypothetical protein